MRDDPNLVESRLYGPYGCCTKISAFNLTIFYLRLKVEILVRLFFIIGRFKLFHKNYYRLYGVLYEQILWHTHLE